ncbi:MAG: LysM peptidoglycan-binding domain-containing protein [Simkaniaceae bacterium]|nr:LysM peptidoglycan-binding domain-containing protein [Simkaniaceae bacterium]
MNRKEMIAVATLVNAGLLVALFISGLVSGGGRGTIEEVAESVSPPLVGAHPEADPLSNSSPASHDVDRNRFSSPTELPSPLTQPVTATTADRFPVPLPVPKRVVVEREAKGEESLLTPETECIDVTVVKGDVLERIARRNNVSIEEIMKCNHLTGPGLRVGQVLRVPVRPKRGIPEKETKEESSREEESFYIVKGGDNPWTIARKNGLRVEELLKINDMDGEKAKRLRPGDRLKIR